MKFHRILFIELIILITINIIKLSFSQTSSLIPLYKIFLTENISYLEINPTFNFRMNSKGVGVIFNNSSDINLIPYHFFNQIYKFYENSYDDIFTMIEELPNGYKEFIIVSGLSSLETIHFIFKDFGIFIPLKELFVPFNIERNEYVFRFLSKEEQENIIFGKDLIESMKIDFKENEKDFIINNKDFIINIEEYNLYY